MPISMVKHGSSVTPKSLKELIYAGMHAYADVLQFAEIPSFLGLGVLILERYVPKKLPASSARGYLTIQHVRFWTKDISAQCFSSLHRYTL